MSKRLFGTDGIRGTAGVRPLDASTVCRVGAALVEVLKRRGDARPRVVLARDTRASGPELREALAEGIRRAGGEAHIAGVLPTPGLALLTRDDRFSAGIMVSASHNPWQDNGVKVFGPDGAKLPDSDEIEIEDWILGLDSLGTDAGGEVDDERTHLHEEYVEFLTGCAGRGKPLEGLSVVLDCAHGAAYEVAPEAFRALGARVDVLAAAPDGRNINDGCGSLYPETLARRVVDSGADLGFAFDGDADRCIGVDRTGTLLDGDFILYYLGTDLHRRGELRGGTVVATVMSNLGLEVALRDAGIGLVRTPVGDKYVLEAMRDKGHNLGGEQSGHIIALDHAPTGDGTLTALLLASLAARGEDPAAARERLPHFPQILLNVKVREKPVIAEHPTLSGAVAEAEAAFDGEGRVVVRYSGTEPKARVMIEGRDQAVVERWAEKLIEIFRREIGLEP